MKSLKRRENGDYVIMHVRIRKDQYDFLKQEDNWISFAVLIRKLLDQYIEALKAVKNERGEEKHD